MNKSQLAKKVAEKTGQSEKDAERSIDATLEVITDSMKSDEEVMLTGFGVFSGRHRHARTGVNPQNPTEKIQIPEVLVPKFKAGKALKDALKEKEASTPEPQEASEPAESEPTPSESAESDESAGSSEPESTTEE